MAKIKLGMNGLGRIGRTVLREFTARQNQGEFSDLEFVAVNSPGDPKLYQHLFKYDSVHGKFPVDVELSGADANQKLHLGSKELAFYGLTDPNEIPWDKHQVDIVIDGTGIFKDKKALGQHIRGSVKKVIMCAPGKDLDGTFVMGINHEDYNSERDQIVSNASCTTNCLAPIAKVLNDAFGIENGFMTTIHAYTADQRLHDSIHSDFRRARAAAISMIPTTTGAAKALGEVIPALSGKLDGYAIRVPTPDVSMVDLTVNLQKEVTKELVNKAMKEASVGALNKILGYCDEPLVSEDFKGRRESSVFDSALTNVIGKSVKVISWYDNEVGFSNRVLDLANFMGQKL